MARPENLVPGNCYFVVSFFDRDLLIPSIDTLLFVEREDPQSGSSWIFQEPPSTDESGKPLPDEEPVLTSFSAEQLYQVLDFPELLQTLGEVAPLHPIQKKPALAPPVEKYQELRRQIQTFLSDPEYVGLTITILYTDDAISIGRDNDAYDLGFYPSVRRDAWREAKLRALFASMGRRPSVDYTVNRGRVRALHFPVSGKLDELHALCGRILLEIFGMRNNDSLTFKFLSRSSLGPVT